MARPRRLVLRQSDDTNITTADRSELLMIDLTGLLNANAQIPLRAVVEEQCDLMCWHERTSGSDLPLWSD